MKISSGYLAVLATTTASALAAFDFHGSTILKSASMHSSFVAKLSSAYSKLDLVTIPSPFPPPNGTYSDTGFLYLTNSFESDCSSPVLSYGLSVDKCTLADSFSYKIQLVQDSCVGAIVQYFRDEVCTNYAGSSDLEPYANNCTIPEQSILFGGDSPVYDMLNCTTSPEPAISADSGVFRNYENSTTCNNDMTSTYIAYACNTCVAVDDYLSFQVNCDNTNSMEITYYTGAGCVHSTETLNYSDTCGVVTDGDDDNYGIDDGEDDDDDDYIPPFINPPPSISTTAFPTVAGASMPESSRIYCQYVNGAPPSAKPSAEPTAVPTESSSGMPSTAYPTSAQATVITFKAKQTIDGINLATYNTNVPLYSYTLSQSIAASMIGVLPSAVQNMIATSATSTATANALLSDVMLSNVVAERGGLRSYASSAISVSYTVTTTTQSSASGLEAQLADSVNSGNFNTLMQSYATVNGATGLETATSEPVTFTTDTDDDSSDNVDLSDGAIAGIAIGGAAGLALLGAGVYYIGFRKEKSLLSQPNVEL